MNDLELARRQANDLTVLQKRHACRVGRDGHRITGKQVLAFAKELVDKMPPASALQSPAPPPDDGPVVQVHVAAVGRQPEAEDQSGV